MTQAVQHVGVTRSGKAIQMPVFSDDPQPDLPAGCALYTPADYFDSYAVFEYLISRELRHRPAETRARVMYQHMSSGHNSKLDKDWRQAERLALGLPTIFDVLEHGKGLTDRVFKD